MKKLVFIFFLFAFNSSYSQYATGTYVIGANMNAGYNKIDDKRYGINSLDLGVTGHLFITNHTVGGVRLFESFINNPFSTRLNKMYGVALFAKNYQQFNDRTGFVSGASISYQNGENASNLSGTFISQYADFINLNLFTGLYCFVYKTIAIEASLNLLYLNYNHQWNDDNKNRYTTEGTSFHFTVPNQFKTSDLTFSILYFIPK